MGYYGITGGGGGGASTEANQWFIYGEVPGPASYTAGGFLIDLDATVTSLNFFKMAVKTISTLPSVQYMITLNPVGNSGKANIELFRNRYDRVSSIDSITGQPSGVTIQTVSGQVVSSESAHTHNANHLHGFIDSSAMTAGGAGVALDALAPAMDAHNHVVYIDDFLMSTGGGTSHNHVDNTIYQHQHAGNLATTSLALVEIANGTNLSTVRWYFCATGVAV